MQISNVNFICNSLCIFQCNLLCTPACKTNIQEPPGKGGIKVLRLRDQLGVSGESYPVLPDHPLPSSRTLLFSSKPPLSSAARGCPVLSSTALIKAASAVTHHQFANKGRAPTSTSYISNSSGFSIQQQCEETPTAVWGKFNSNSSVRKVQQQCEESSTPTAVWGKFNSNSSVRKAQLQQQCEESPTAVWGIKTTTSTTSSPPPLSGPLTPWRAARQPPPSRSLPTGSSRVPLAGTSRPTTWAASISMSGAGAQERRLQQWIRQQRHQLQCARVTGSLDARQVPSTTSSSAAARSTTSALGPRPPWRADKQGHKWHESCEKSQTLKLQYPV